VQDPFTQADDTHGVLLPQAPLDEQVSTLLLTHRVAFGVQTPVQFPPTHAWLVQGVVFCQLPPPSQVCGCCPLHCLAPGVHAVQLPAVQTSGHADPFCQAPLESQVCGTSPLHCLVPGVQTPVQAPLTHAWLVHVTGALHVPLELQVWTPLPEHCVVPGTQTPVQEPLTHADATHAVVEPHWPLELHVCVLFPEQRVAPGAHTPVHAPFTHV
jgi:hypothetical protein